MSNENGRGNGNGNVQGHGKGDNAKPHIFGRPTGDPITFYGSFYDYGHKYALDQGADERQAEVEERLRSFAGQSALCLAASPYDPEGNPADRLSEERHERDLADLRDREQEVAHARAELRDRERDLAGKEERERPEAPSLIALLAVLAIAVTMTLTFHDLVFAKLFAATIQAVLAAAVCGIFISGLVAWGTLAAAKHESSILIHCLSVGICLLFSLALLFLRMGGAHGERDHWIAYGFAGIELASLLVVEVFAYGLRREWKRFRETHRDRSLALQHVETARGFLEDRVADRDACRKRLLDHDEAVAERESSVKSASLVASAAEEAIVLGYRHGLAANQGHLFGNITLRPTREEVLERLRATTGIEDAPLREKSQP